MAAETPLSDAALVGELLKGCYQIEERVGKGGMAWVYRATHTMLLETVAVKILFSQHAAEPELRERFLREARLQARVKHPHVVRVTDFIDERGVVGLVQEWIEGGDLQKWFEQRAAPLSPQEVAILMLPIIDAVAHAHREGVIHRDLKPSNIMLVPQESWLPLPKLADFGLARQQEAQGLTATNSSLGTPLYMAPEQFMNAKEVDKRADIYSLGVILYQLSAGQLPFYGELNSLLYQVFHAERQPPPHVEEPLASVILRCIDKDPKMRFSSCEDLAERIREVCLGQGDAATLTDLEQMGEVDLPTGAFSFPEDDADQLAHSAIEASEAPTQREHRPEAQRERPELLGRPIRPIAPQMSPEQPNIAVAEQQQQKEHSNTGLLVVLLLVFLAVGGAAFWGIRKMSSAQTHTPHERTKSNAHSTRQTKASTTGYPTRRRPPPRHRGSVLGTGFRSRPKTLGGPVRRRPGASAPAQRLLRSVQRAYGGKTAFLTIKKMFFQGRLIRYDKGSSETYLIRCFAIYPGHQRIELEGNDGQRHVQVLSPTVARLTTAGRTKLLPRRTALDVLLKRTFGTMEFMPIKRLAQIKLGRPSWIGSRQVERLILTDHAGHSVTLLVDRKSHHILKREYALGGTRYTYFYTQFRFFRVPKTKYRVLFPMRKELYKNGSRYHFLQLNQLRPNAMEIQRPLFQ